jgi:hypothetical protein
VVFPALALALLALQASPSTPAARPESAAVVQEPSRPKQAPPKQAPKPPPQRNGSIGGSRTPAPRPPAQSGQPRGTGEPKLKRRGN